MKERRRVEERQSPLARELDHRAKNALAVVQAALRLTPRDDAETVACTVEGRVSARARALLSQGHRDGAELSGPPLLLAPGAARALSMALHEPVANAVKHGALPVPGGRVSLRWSADDGAPRLRLARARRGAPGADRRQGGPGLEGVGVVREAALPLSRVLAGGAAPADLP